MTSHGRSRRRSSTPARSRSRSSASRGPPSTRSRWRESATSSTIVDHGEGEGGMMRRTSDADRERVARQLRRRWLQGYLSLDTSEVRLGRAYAAHTGAELEAVVGDLPRFRSHVVAWRDALVRWLDAAFPKRAVTLALP